MISPDSCDQLVGGNYDILVEEPEPKLKSILTNFLERFDRHQEEFAALAQGSQKSCSYADEFRLLKEFSKTLKEDKSNLREGELEVNMRKNRYKDIIPFSHTRVLLNVPQSDGGQQSQPGADYINANYVRGPSGSKRAYIACQGPLPSTLNDFWRMIWECGVSVIVMACNQDEPGSNEPKCELYWPEEPESSSIYGNIQVKLVKVRRICQDFLIRKLAVKLLEPESTSSNANHQTSSQVVGASNETETHENQGNFKEQNNNQQQEVEQRPKPRRVLLERTICQFHYTTWPDHGVPKSVEPILELVRLVRDVQPAENKPILVHCSAGCGRTGTICCIDYVWGLLRRGKLDTNFNLCNIISEMRQQRMSMVQTLEQYILCHKAVAALFINQLNLIESHLYTANDCEDDQQRQQQQHPGEPETSCRRPEVAVIGQGGDEEEEDSASDTSKSLQDFDGPVFI